MKLNSELLLILGDLGKSLPESYVKEKLKTLDDRLLLNFKTPNLFYKLNRVYDSEGTEITSLLDDENLKGIKASLAQAYFNYFVHYNTTFNKKYYTVIFKLDPNSTGNLLVEDAGGSDNL